MTTDDFSVSERGGADEAHVVEQATVQDGAAVLLAQANPVATPIDPAGGQPAGQQAPAALPETVSPDASNVVRLPAGVSIENIVVEGADLVLVQPDGTAITIVNAAHNIPTFIIGDVEIPLVALAAALEANGINVAAGPDGQLAVVAGNDSAGANFTSPNAGWPRRT